MKVIVNLTLISLLLLSLLFPLWAQEVVVDAPGDLSGCRARYAWYDSDKVPIIDPLSRAESESKHSLAALDEVIRQEIQSRMKKRGWNLDASAPCQLRYSLFQQLDLGVAQHETGVIIPRSSTGVGATTTGALDAHLERMGTLTIEVVDREAEGNAWLWQGTLTDELGKPKERPGKAKDLVRKIIHELP